MHNMVRYYQELTLLFFSDIYVYRFYSLVVYVPVILCATFGSCLCTSFSGPQFLVKIVHVLHMILQYV